MRYVKKDLVSVPGEINFCFLMLLNYLFFFQTLSRKNPNQNLMHLFVLRAKMQHFVSTLQYYLHADVLEAKFAELMQKIGNFN